MNVVAVSQADHATDISWRRLVAVPELTAGTMGRFRVVFGLLLMWAVLNDPPVSQALDLHRNYSPLADWAFVHAIAASPIACVLLQVATLALVSLFIVGFWTRTAYTGLVAAILLGRLVLLQSRGTHDWDLPLLTLCALLVIPWGDGFSIDARRAAPGVDRGGAVYGMAIWIPGLMLGLALAAAAYAKVANAGVAWITTGAVRYHFVEDAANAPFQLGLWVAAQPSAAVLLSLAALVLEAIFIVHVFVPSPSWRLAFGVAGLFLFAGLYAFQGVLWWAWLALFSAFLPWQWLDRAPLRPAQARPLQRRHLVLIAALVAQQVAASATATELEPLISNYPMYSSTYASPAEFDRVYHRRLQQLSFDADGTDVTSRVQDIPNGAELLFNVAQDVAAGASADAPALERFCAAYRERYHDAVSRIAVTADRTAFDWQRGAFTPRTRVTVARLIMPAGCR